MAWLFKGLAWLLVGVLALVATIWRVWSTGLDLFWPFVGLVVAGISLHRSLKAFVEFWRRRISERVEIEVAAERDTYLPGDVVNVSVRVTGKEDLDIQEGLVLDYQPVFPPAPLRLVGTRFPDQRMQRVFPRLSCSLMLNERGHSLSPFSGYERRELLRKLLLSIEGHEGATTKVSGEVPRSSSCGKEKPVEWAVTWAWGYP